MLLTIWKWLWVLWELPFLWILDRKDEILLILFIVLNHIGPAARAIITQGTQNRGRGRKRRKGRKGRKNSNRDVCRGQCRPSWAQGVLWRHHLNYYPIYFHSQWLSRPLLPTSLPLMLWGFHCLGWNGVQGRIKNSVLRFGCQSWLRKPISERKKD